jgi:hypothetical protein
MLVIGLGIRAWQARPASPAPPVIGRVARLPAGRRLAIAIAFRSLDRGHIQPEHEFLVGFKPFGRGTITGNC